MSCVARSAVLAALAALLPAAAGAAPAPTPRPKVAVLDPQVAGGVERSATEGLAALLASEVARRPALGVVSGADLRALLGYEQQRALVGCTVDACAAGVASALGAAFLLSSEVSKVGSTWVLGLSLLDARKATSVSRTSRKAASLEGLVELAPAAIDELLEPLGPLAETPPPTRYDGSWEVAIECPPLLTGTRAKGYAYRLPAVVKDGRFSAARLAEDAPAMLRIEGTIAPDGQAQLTARARTGPAEYSVKAAVPGTPYSYGIAATFEPARGTGRRVEGRACSFTFTRQSP